MRCAIDRRSRFDGLSVDIDEGRKAEDKLRSTQAKLSRASEIAAVAELSASIAHEINQPLAAIVANAQTCHRWLSSDAPNIARAKIAIDRIIRDRNAAAEVIRRIRALFKQAAPAKSTLHFNEIIDEVRRSLQDHIDRKGIVVELDSAQSLPPRKSNDEALITSAARSPPLAAESDRQAREATHGTAGCVAVVPVRQCRRLHRRKARGGGHQSLLRRRGRLSFSSL